MGNLSKMLQYLFFMTIYQAANIRHLGVATLQSVSIKKFMNYRSVPKTGRKINSDGSCLFDEKNLFHCLFLRICCILNHMMFF